MTTKRKKSDFDQSLTRLESLVTTLERGDIPIEEALDLFEQGVKLARECQGSLRDAQQKVEILLADGETRQPFEPAE
ncbi:MAG: exodeoxyribonuclease VII small subunit [Pseudomonadales bacterium]|jgi:exodeoxyribonuclease VII small subunit|nr:exodeoxyribonuclease VII small subunit [Pseudomonadales bacterium]MCC6530804.1 exodeoxyribonuclease VII small subunit [Pseudomonadales bacterium]MCP5332158.1 exodeoxyribonuclease VII small subunit [Pseudomonadales bacterium]HMU90346.1 exodeoxyribonuclease VII small subunit [Pseudomonadales bacterium]HMW15028.1 exodeoxyribonuclease VII small subunit [Pseudomonadales bacterium]